MDLCPAVADNHPSPLPVYTADHEAKNDAKAAEVDYPLKNRGFDQVPFIGSCHGLMCVRPDPDTVLLFNPSIKDVPAPSCLSKNLCTQAFRRIPLYTIMKAHNDFWVMECGKRGS
jgi:hypothetical protein